eukprot:scaffold5364_cov164-Amphora_coffeaeformis.AAC.32
MVPDISIVSGSGERSASSSFFLSLRDFVRWRALENLPISQSAIWSLTYSHQTCDSTIAGEEYCIVLYYAKLQPYSKCLSRNTQLVGVLPPAFAKGCRTASSMASL